MEEYSDLSGMLADALTDGQRIGVEISLEDALFIASGLQTQEELDSYRSKVDALEEAFRRSSNMASEPLGIGYNIHRFIYGNRGIIYELGQFRPTTAVDRLTERNGKVGNCLALCSLYAILGERLGLKLAVLDGSSSGHGHVMMKLYCGDISVPVETTSVKGFNLRWPKNAAELGLYCNYLYFRQLRNSETLPLMKNRWDIALLAHEQALPELSGMSDYDITLAALACTIGMSKFEEKPLPILVNYVFENTLLEVFRDAGKEATWNSR